MLSKAKSRFCSGKKICIYLFLLSLIFNLESSFGQGGTWTWISGDSATNSPGVFGIQGVPSVNNHPPGFYEPAEWKDKQGNFWIYGGSYPDNSDLWKFNPSTLEWTWVKGDGGANEPPIYGIQGVPDILNSPGTRQWTAATWVDTTGALWLFGGNGDSLLITCHDDLWKYDIGTNQWTWIKGDSAIDVNGVYGTQGVPSPLNNPGARMETSSAWTDTLNNLWLFGGQAFDINSAFGPSNDLFEYNIGANEWTWINGSSSGGASANYGVEGVTDPGNDPGARFTYVKWKDVNNNFWMMGGYAYVVPRYSPLNDVWKYDVRVNEWTWMDGTNVANDSGIYNATCAFDTVNRPGSRMEQRAAVTDNCGNFWLFGGLGNAFSAIGDLWFFNPQQLKWNWLSGSNVPGEPGNYGSLGVASPLNMPPARAGAVAWWGNDDKLYLFGGTSDMNTTRQYCDVWVFDPDTNCVPACGIVANFQASNATLCTYDCIGFTDLSTRATSWQWTFEGGTPATSSDRNPQHVCYTVPGIYNVILIASNAAGSDAVTFTNFIHVVASPPTPSITQHHDTLICSTNPAYTGYQWYADSALIPGATDTSVIIAKGGNYNVEVLNENGCKIAVGINVVLGLQNYMSDHDILLWPNPVLNKIEIHDSQFMIHNCASCIVHFELYNVLGQMVSQFAITNSQSEIDVSTLPAGIYFVQAQGERTRWVAKFVKE